MAVKLITEDQKDLGTGNLEDVYDITFTISPLSGDFNVTVAQAGDPVAAAKAAIDAKTAQVQGILGL